MMEKGYLALLLHAHLPFVRHPEHEDFLEEDWFYEAVTETYVPLIRVFEGLARDGVDFRLTLCISPTLASMFQDALLQQRYLRRLGRLIELAEREIERTRWRPELHRLAWMYHERFTAARETFADRYGCDLTRAFRQLHDAGRLELITCAATHAYLPLMNGSAGAVRAQVQVGVDHHRSVFGRPPRGLWLPECGYDRGVDRALKDAGVEYFVVDAHGMLYASPRPKCGVYAPVYCPSGVAAFGRDLESSKQVWSAREGYPGDPVYREFYRDVGYDLEYEYIRPYLHADGERRDTGIKYHRITGPTEEKEPYDPDAARVRAAEHAADFLASRQRQAAELCTAMGKQPIILAPYDAELFGHWWFEGPEWLDFLLRKIHFDQEAVRLMTPGEYLDAHPVHQVSAPSPSSWGWRGYNEVWLEGGNDWIYRHLHKMSQRMSEVARLHAAATGPLARALKQAGREVLLAQSSDWAFIMKTGTMVDYAVRRTKEHISRFNRLYEAIRSGRIDEPWLAEVEARDNIFPGIDYRVFR